jgi:hypothetical protein
MGIIQKTLAAIFPKRKAVVILNEQKELFNAIINALPDEFSDVKAQAENNNFLGFKNWSLHPDFKYTEITYPGENYFKYKKRGRNSKISGLTIFSKTNKKFEEIEILLWDNLIWALKISHSNYDLKEFDLSSIKGKNAIEVNFEFPARQVDLFYDSLDEHIKQKLDYNDVLDIDYFGETFYTFCELEDGNYLAVNNTLEVYSIVHDAEPMLLKMEIPFIDILEQLASNQFDKEQHLDKRYADQAV